MLFAILFVTAVVGQEASAEVTVRISDVTTLKGYSINHLVGTGLVVGLRGTGDGDQYEATMRKLAQALGNLATPVRGLAELKDTKNVAIVMIDAVVPEHGVREGDRIDVHVSALGSAGSLAGGRLLVTPLVYHDRDVQKIFAYASGPIHLGDPEITTVGAVEAGALINEDVLVGFISQGHQIPFSNSWIKPTETYITYVLDGPHAGWGLAVAIAEAINAELSLVADTDRVALAVDPKNVVVWVPTVQREDPAAWIRDIEELSTLMPASEARVTIDRSSGTVVVSGNARISPVIVSHKGMTVLVRIPAVDPAEPRLESQEFVALASPRVVPARRDGRSTVSDLLQALNQLKVPIDDRIAILTDIQRAGKLHAKLVFKD